MNVKDVLSSCGSPAVLDARFDEGSISLKLSAHHQESLSTWAKAKEAFVEADDSTQAWFTSERVDKIPFCPPDETLHLFVVSYNQSEDIRESSISIVDDLSRCGLRPARFEELMAVAILRPALFTLPVRLIALNAKLDLPAGVGWLANLNDSYVPFLSWMGNQRTLGSANWASLWNEYDRFLCAPV